MADNLIHQILPTKEQWFEQESSRIFLAPNKIYLTVLLKLLATGILFFYAPLILTVMWAALTFGVLLWTKSIIVQYNALHAKPKSIFVTASMARIVSSFKMASLGNCFVWCGFSFISQIWLPIEMRIAGIVILNAVMFVSLAHNYVDLILMRRNFILLLISQFVSKIFCLAANDFELEMVKQAHLYNLYLLLNGILLWTIGDRLNKIHVQHLDSEYSKMQLIETLNENKAQLNIEQQALVASNKLVQQFYSGAAHDLRQPVYAMQLYTSMLLDDLSNAKVILPKIAASCTSINDMFNTLFDYQQTHMNDTGLVETKIDIQETIHSLDLHFQPIAIGKGLQIRFKPIAGSITMVPLYLVRILGNLITNALRYTNTGGVLVAARHTHKGIRFEIWDTGIGIERSKLEHIFSEFYRINKVDSENHGLGLGLAITKQLTSRIPHAEISVQSRVGRGSVFKFSVPLERYSLRSA